MRVVPGKSALLQFDLSSLDYTALGPWHPHIQDNLHFFFNYKSGTHAVPRDEAYSSLHASSGILVECRVKHFSCNDVAMSTASTTLATRDAVLRR